MHSQNWCAQCPFNRREEKATFVCWKLTVSTYSPVEARTCIQQAEVGAVRIGKVEKEGKRNRRVRTSHLDD